MTVLELGPEPRFLLVRPDKIGDVILTTPAVLSLKKKFPRCFIGFLCRSYTAPLLEHNPSIDQILLIDSPASLGRQVQRVKDLKFDAAVHFYLDWRSVLITSLAGVPVRIGPLSKFPAFLLNRRVVQNRSKVEKHEALYNLDLVKECGAEERPESPGIYLTESEKKRGKELLAGLCGREGIKPVLIHPGSAGSAKNWPADFYFRLGEKLSESNFVLFSGGKGEESILEKVGKSLKNTGVIPAGSLSLRELAAVISQSRLMISNSTGPLHMAVALDIPTVSFYPQLPLVTSAKRWGPFGPAGLHRVLSPLDPLSSMSSISVSEAAEAARQALAGDKMDAGK